MKMIFEYRALFFQIILFIMITSSFDNTSSIISVNAAHLYPSLVTVRQVRMWQRESEVKKAERERKKTKKEQKRLEKAKTDEQNGVESGSDVKTNRLKQVYASIRRKLTSKK